jgi:predicted nucleic acid-binding protein
VSAKYLLDTNVLSESRRKQADAGVVTFLGQTEPSLLMISVLTLGELRKGIILKRKTDPDAAERLEVWVDGLEISFAAQILGIDASAARLWGEWSAQRPRPIIDTLLAAIAFTQKLTLVTRNTADVADLPVEILNPWR